MATSDTGSSLALWGGLSLHQPSRGLSLGHAGGGGADYAKAGDSSAAAAAAAVTSPMSAGSDGSPTHRAVAAGVEGPRVGKPAAKRRSRASRRAPVTLLNTDTTNFRAMVQQFTGIPAPSPFSGAGVPVINFAADYGFLPPAAVMPFDQLHQRPALTFEDHLHRTPPQHYAGAAFGYNDPHAGGHAGDLFTQGLESAEDRMLLQSMQAAQMPASTANHSTNGYFA